MKANTLPTTQPAGGARHRFTERSDLHRLPVVDIDRVGLATGDETALDPAGGTVSIVSRFAASGGDTD